MATPDIALGTGGNRGIGFEACHQLTETGFTVLLTAREAAKAKAAAKKRSTAKREVFACTLNVTRAATIERVVREVEAEHGRLDVLINNAAVGYDFGTRASAADLGEV